MVLNTIGLTGATGMLGRHVRAALELVGARVIGSSREHQPSLTESNWDLEDWRTHTELDSIFTGVQAIVHVGAMVPRKSVLVNEAGMFNANVRSCLNLGLWAISRKLPIVHVSGAIVYAKNDCTSQQEDAALGWTGLGGVYGLSKLLAEDTLKRLRQNGLRLAIVRPSSIYGYGLPAEKMISRFLAMAESGSTIELAQPVDDRVDLIHATDVSRAILAILDAEAWEVFNVASGVPVSIKELADHCVAVVGRGKVKVMECGQSSHIAVTRFALNSKRAKDHLGWRPVIDLKLGLTMMVQKDICLETRALINH